MNERAFPHVFSAFESFVREFLDPLSRRKLTRTKVPLSAMPGWETKLSFNHPSHDEIRAISEAVARLETLTRYKGYSPEEREAAYQALAELVLRQVTVESVQGRYTIEGWHCELEQGPEWDPLPDDWYQPGSVQPPGIVAQIVDLEGYALVRAVWEPGNVAWGWKDSALLADVSAKHSPGNREQWATKGMTPPLADFVEDLRADPTNVVGQIKCAPYDGARDDKANFHGCLRASRGEITAAIGKLDPRAQRRYALVSPALLDQLVEEEVVPIHLRDLMSLMRKA